MIRKRTLKQLCLVILGFCLVIPTAGCGAQQDVEDINETIVTQTDTSEQQDPESEPESQPVSQADTEQDSTSVETASEEISSEEELSEEDLYWQEVLGEFEKSSYDLTTALTEPALKDYCSDYFTIQRCRYGGTITMDVQADSEALLDCQILKFTLQPLVENAIFHGIEPKGTGHISIHAMAEEGKNGEKDIRIVFFAFHIFKSINIQEITSGCDSCHRSKRGVPNGMHLVI